MKKVLFCFLTVGISFTAGAQVAVNANNAAPHSSAMLDVSSADKGLLIPRMTSALRTSINGAAKGLLVMDTTTNSLWYHNGTSWGELSAVKSNLWEVNGNNIYKTNIGNVGIGTTTPEASALLHVYSGLSTNGFLVSGPPLFGIPTIVPDLGPGPRMMYYPGRYAFRAGKVSGNEWNDINVGTGSMATGYDNTASGNFSSALGRANTAAGDISTALGYLNIARGYASTVVGMNNDPILALDQGVSNAATPLFIVGNGESLVAKSNAMVVLKNGNAGIGNFVPQYRLDVGDRMRLRGGGTFATSAGLWLNNLSNTDEMAFFGVYSDSHIGWYGAGASAWNLVMNTDNGNVGIGNQNPGYRLDVSGRMRIRSAGGANTAGIYFNQSDNTTTRSFVGMLNDDYLGFFGAPLNAFGLVMSVTTGNVGIGTLTPSQKLHVAGNICYTGSIAACSDIRYKTNVLPLTNALSSVIALNGISYNWDKVSFSNKGFTDEKQIGFSAQEIEKIYPEVVQTDSEGYKSVDYSRLTPVLVEAIKEQQKQIDLLKSDNKKLRALEDKIAAVEAKIKSLLEVKNAGN